MMTCLRLGMIYKGTGLDWLLAQTPDTVQRLSNATMQLLEEMKAEQDG